MLTAITITMVMLSGLAALLVPLAVASGSPALEGTRFHESSPGWRVVAIVAATSTSVVFFLAAVGTWLTATI